MAKKTVGRTGGTLMNPHARRALAAVTVGALAFAAGCATLGGDSARQGGDPATRVLQSVDVRLGPSGTVEGLTGTAVLLNEANGGMRSESTDYATDEVVNDLPIRVTTGYRTSQGSGSDLSKLKGYSGKVEIEITLENLTVKPETLSYDSAGQKKTAPALVGVPLSVAASATLPGTSPGALVFDSESKRSTNGVVSASEKGSSKVQWGVLLAPPQTEATTTLRLVANVKNFTVPQLDVSVQAGLRTDLSFEGALASAIENGPDSQVAMQQKAIKLVAEINDVLTRAGSTVTEVRKNLNDTSATLGASAVTRLDTNSRQITQEMNTLGAELASLKQGLSGSVDAASDSMNSDFAEIVNAMGDILGDTNTPPPAVTTEQDCATKLKGFAPNGTVYSMFSQMSGLLDGYAEASEGCQKQIREKLGSTIGPEEPSAEVCDAEKSASATCSLFAGKSTVHESLKDLEDAGAQLAEELKSPTVEDAHAMSTGLAEKLDDVDALITALEQDNAGAEEQQQLLSQLTEVESEVSNLASVHEPLVKVSQRLRQIDENQTAIAARVCNLGKAPNQVNRAELDALSAQLAGVNCAGKPFIAPPIKPMPGQKPETPLPVTDLPAQADAVDAAAESLVAEGDSDIARLSGALGTLKETVNAKDEREGASSISPETAKQMRSELETATASVSELQSKLEDAQSEQDSLSKEITTEFAQAADETGAAVAEDLDRGIADLNSGREQTDAQLSESYSELIAGLRTSASDAASDGKKLVESQKTELANSGKASQHALSDRTAQALQSIDQSTSASTRDVKAASVQLSDGLNKVLLDLGDPKIKGSGILGSISASAAKSDTADFQLAEASQHAAGFANVRDQDLSALQLRSAQFRAALEKSDSLPPFHLSVPKGATSQTIYSLHFGGSAK
ncbi:hypothetical protein JD292_05085 [Leucobacter sp. CSA2]|uniref:Uncharacterized protein n=1 Tax=Leucobacter edaphi TaxID=2796472 RepID=A0A934UXC1_9MICO|nr:hypothetical protein [Leucobacter edaphi]MBK0421446.1 hypothetical protein [Leucobacter edaphi]